MTMVAREPMSQAPPKPLPAAPGELPPSPAVRRLSLYLRQLEAFLESGRKTVSSRDLGNALGLGDAQVRKDLTAFGSFGHPGVGYDALVLAGELRHILGTDKTWPTVLVGVGNIGRALMAYGRFEGRGFRVVAALDADLDRVNTRVGSVVVQHVDDLDDAVRASHARLAVLAVPEAHAQSVAESLVRAGIRGILNFAPVRLDLPKDVSVIDVDLGAQLEQLAFHVRAAHG